MICVKPLLFIINRKYNMRTNRTSTICSVGNDSSNNYVCLLVYCLNMYCIMYEKYKTIYSPSST